MFVVGIKHLGKNWSLIHKLIGSRSSAQARSHSQKYFSRLRKSRENPDKLPFVNDKGEIMEERLTNLQ
jgi:hypothetical protein